MNRVINGRYELVHPIGRGGMGEVWAGYDIRLDREIAVKLLRRELLPVDLGAHGEPMPTRARALVERFVREARMTARVQHPGVPAVYDAGNERGELFLAMQLLSGTSLADVIAERRRLVVGEAVALAAQLASVLAAAHDVSLVHRDLKPANVIVTVRGEVKVLDFGIAAILEPDVTRLTAADETLGSPAYMAPEQVLHGAISPRTDLYALGCVLHEMLTGDQLFEGDTAFAQMEKHVSQAPPGVRSIRAEVPADIDALVTELLAKDPAERPSDAAEVYERLRAHVLETASPEGAAPTVGDPRGPFRDPFAPGRSEMRRSRRRLAPAGSPVTTVAIDVMTVRQEAADLVDEGRFTQAVDLLSGAIDAVRRSGGSGEAERDLVLARAGTRAVGEDFAAALPDFEWVLQRVPEDSSAAMSCRVQIANCRAAMGDTATALEDFAALESLLVERRGPFERDVVDVRRQLAMLKAAVGDVSGALDQLTSLAEDLASDDPHHPALADLRAQAAHLRRMRDR